MIELLGHSLVKGYGQLVLSWARFVPAASPAAQVLGDQFGITSIVRTAAGTWTVTLSEKAPGFIVIPGWVENDGTNLHVVNVESYDFTAGTFVMKHRTAAYGSLGSLAASDTIDEINLLVVGRKAT